MMIRHIYRGFYPFSHADMPCELIAFSSVEFAQLHGKIYLQLIFTTHICEDHWFYSLEFELYIVCRLFHYIETRCLIFLNLDSVWYLYKGVIALQVIELWFKNSSKRVLYLREWKISAKGAAMNQRHTPEYTQDRKLIKQTVKLPYKILQKEYGSRPVLYIRDKDTRCWVYKYWSRVPLAEVLDGPDIKSRTGSLNLHKVEYYLEQFREIMRIWRSAFT